MEFIATNMANNYMDSRFNNKLVSCVLLIIII